MTVFTSNHFAQACQFILQGNLIAYPTEAVWGMGCDPFNERAVRQILTIKNRQKVKGMIVLAPSINSIQPFFQNLSSSQTQTIIKSWQKPNLKQATTWLFPIPQDLTVKIPDWVTGGRNSLAIRLITQPNLVQLCQTLISPNNPYGFLISTSCNPSGLPPAKTLAEAQAYFGHFPHVGYLDDSTLGYTQPSQIKNAMTGEVVRE